jgi:hypothetical protein
MAKGILGKTWQKAWKKLAKSLENLTESLEIWKKLCN